jgi:hypothetical protein
MYWWAVQRLEMRAQEMEEEEEEAEWSVGGVCESRMG